jgi:16S rRNA (cytosine1402-N4)-methyltransferase
VPTHIPVLAEKAVELLGCSPGKVVVDATVGGGGHARLILRRIGQTGRLIGFDCDREAIELTRARAGSNLNFLLVHENFCNVAVALRRLGVKKIDALLLDLGLSSFQLDTATRGFSFNIEASLDMRMDVRLKTTAADIVNTYSERAIADILSSFGEEPRAGRIAKAIVRERSKKKIETTTELADLVRRCIPRKGRPPRIDPATRTFQALRIEVNSELDNLKAVLDDAIPLLNPGGRLCVISFHSLEDRIVKQTFARASRGCVCPPDFPKCVCRRKPVLKILTPKPVRPSSEEIATNPRSRSARLRAAEKIAEEAIP